MASSIMFSSAAVASPAQPTRVAPFTGLKSIANLPTTRKANNDLSHLPSNGGRVQCMQVWPPEGLKKFETLSYLPQLTDEQLFKQVEYLLREGWIPSIEFSKVGFVYRENNRSPGYYDGRYWTMWKLPMFGCNDAGLVVKELKECNKEYPNYYARIISYDNVRQVQCSSFIAYKPPNPAT
ncbi:ribulose bisphosphate carboxylase small subunit, chloroplastic 5-like [Aristolochia californica]|uniref:ribulose bisphosphate carboxylase small subunit, chloroplastic 5-like n=1 Tax=Aristolochia californica TaxID=171875 RepID=UPI0035D8FAF5